MSNYKFKLLIKPEEIYNNLLPEQKSQFDNVQITKSTLLDSGNVEIECLALESEVIEAQKIQVMSFSDGVYTSVKDF